MAIIYNNKNDNLILREGVKLLQDMKIQDYNNWRMKDMSIIPDINGQNFLGKDLSEVYLNGTSCIGTNLSCCNLSKANFVQADLSMANLEGANLSDALLMWSQMK